MSKISEEEIQKILPIKGPSFTEVKNYSQSNKSPSHLGKVQVLQLEKEEKIGKYELAWHQ